MATVSQLVAHADPPLPELLDRKLILSRILPASERTFARMLSKGEFPQPDLRFTQKQQFWRRSTVLTWLQNPQSGGSTEAR